MFLYRLKVIIAAVSTGLYPCSFIYNSMIFRWLGHSAIELKEGEIDIAIDPLTEARIEPDVICLTHGHSDHLGSTIKIAKDCNCKVLAAFELAHYLESKGVEAVGMNLGGSVDVDGIRITMVEAKHSSSIMEGNDIIYAGEPCGFVIEGSITAYHAGDTSLFSDMGLIRELYSPDVSFIPVGGFYTMDERQALIAARILGSRMIVPIHYNTFDAIKTDLTLLKKNLDERLFLPEIGERYEI
jgi:L-ascorbate metabolism protein UlaG (beta-lactamase superfamily)